MMESSTLQPPTKRERIAWYFYDFGNSAYAAVVLLAVYSAYFKGQVVGGPEGTRLWGLAVGIAMFVVAVTSPVLGTLADFSGTKKRFLFFYTTLACVFTAMLFFVLKGDIFTGMLFFILAETGYRSAQVFYNALLPEIASPDEMGRVSGNGWAIGSSGGIVCLLIVLALIMTVHGTLVVRLSFIITAIFYVASTMPLFLWLRERKERQPLPKGESYTSFAFKRLWNTFQEIKQLRELVKFILAFLIFNNGIMIVMDFAAIIGAVLYGLTQQQLIIFMIIVQVTSVAGAFVCGLIADRYSGKRALIISILLMVLSVAWLFFSTSLTEFYLIGALAGFALTGVQSVSRMMVGLLSPPEKSAEFYGFFAVAGHISSFIGPMVFGLAAAGAASWFQRQGLAGILAEQSGQRWSLLLIIAFLFAGLASLLLVNEREGRAAAWLRRMKRPVLREGIAYSVQGTPEA